MTIQCNHIPKFKPKVVKGCIYIKSKKNVRDNIFYTVAGRPTGYEESETDTWRIPEFIIKGLIGNNW